jgi:hypothetical protein
VIPPQLQQQAGAQFVSAEYVSGARQPTQGQETVVRITYRVRNPLNERLDYNATVTFDAGADARFISADPTTGTVNVQPSQVQWRGFELDPGESAEITLTMSVTPAACTPGDMVLLITGTRTTARTASGGIVDVTSGPLAADVVAGLTSGVCAAPAAVVPPAPVAAPPPVAPPPPVAAAQRPPLAVGGPQPVVTVTVARPAAPPPATSSALPRAGAGLTADSEPRAALPGLLAIAGLFTIVAWVARRRNASYDSRRERDRPSRTSRARPVSICSRR